jgi:hypothetical protein
MISARKLAGAPSLTIAAALCAAAARAAGPNVVPPAIDLRPGQEVTFPVTVADGRVTPGGVRLSKPGSAQPKDGEITVSVVKQGLSPYAELTAIEKTPALIDFVASGLIGDIKIDEVRVCGRVDGPVTTRIASGSWRVSLNRFVPAPDLGCP